MLQFYETIMGEKFYAGTMPKLVRAIENLAEQQKETNELLKQLLGKNKEDNNGPENKDH